MLYQIHDTNDVLHPIQFVHYNFDDLESPGRIVKHGLTVNNVLFVLKQQVEYLQSVLPCEENKAILEHLYACISLVMDREAKRLEQGVLHTLKPHQ